MLNRAIFVGVIAAIHIGFFICVACVLRINTHIFHQLAVLWRTTRTIHHVCPHGACKVVIRDRGRVGLCVVYTTHNLKLLHIEFLVGGIRCIKGCVGVKIALDSLVESAICVLVVVNHAVNVFGFLGIDNPCQVLNVGQVDGFVVSVKILRGNSSGSGHILLSQPRFADRHKTSTIRRSSHGMCQSDVLAIVKSPVSVMASRGKEGFFCNPSGNSFNVGRFIFNCTPFTILCRHHVQDQLVLICHLFPATVDQEVVHIHSCRSCNEHLLTIEQDTVCIIEVQDSRFAILHQIDLSFIVSFQKAFIVVRIIPLSRQFGRQCFCLMLVGYRHRCRNQTNCKHES